MVDWHIRKRNEYTDSRKIYWMSERLYQIRRKHEDIFGGDSFEWILWLSIGQVSNPKAGISRTKRTAVTQTVFSYS